MADGLSAGRDNRKYQRVSFKRGVRFKQNEHDVYQGELAQDLSAGGIRLRSNVFVPVGQEIVMGIQFRDFAEVVEVAGQVVWVRCNPYSETYVLGVQFREDSFLPRHRIARFIDSF
jgi:Tfp pilus assembly protein PilZ